MCDDENALLVLSSHGHTRTTETTNSDDRTVLQCTLAWFVVQLTFVWVVIGYLGFDTYRRGESGVTYLLGVLPQAIFQEDRD